MKRSIFSFFVGVFLLITMQVFASAPASVFQDISSSSPFYDAVKYMKDQGIVQGYADGNFKANVAMNRAEFLKIVLGSQADFSLAAAEKCVQDKSVQASSSMDFSDVPFEAWFTPYICYAEEKGIIQGYADNTFRPDQLIVVPEMAKIVAKTQNLSLAAVQVGEEWYAPYMRSLAEKKAIPTTVNTIDHQVSRGEMAEVLYRVVKNIEDKPFTSLDTLKVALLPIVKSGELGKIKDCAILSQIFAKLPQESTRANAFLEKSAPMEAPTAVGAVPTAAPEAVNDATTTSTSGGAGANAVPDFSQTNVQVEGVDEADIVKNDAKYIYLIKGNTIRIVDAYPATSMKEVGKITFDNTNFTPQEMFVAGDKLIAIGNVWQNSPHPILYQKMMVPSFAPTPSQNMTIVYVVNIADRSVPKVERTVQYEGSYTQSRRIGDRVYLVMNKQNRWYHPMYKDASTNLVPQVSDSAISNGKFEAACACGAVQYFPGFENPDYLIVSVVPIDDVNKEITKEVLLGSAENLYMSPSSLFVSTGAQEPGESYWSWNNTQVYKFAINDMSVTHTGTAKVAGRILNQFAMDEFDNYFRIATMKDQEWSKEGDKSTSRLYVLDKDMNQVGALMDIAPGEQMHSVRFMGDRAFMVTFKQVDPLFVIDLKDPKKPTILGELKVPGWSDYLHPYDENHLIGFGKEVDASIDADKVHGGDAVYYTAVQGLKVSLFDVTDLKNPKEMSKIVIGDRGTESDILNNHKALLFDKANGLLAFPINIQQKQDPTVLQCTKNRFSTCPSSCERRCIPTTCTQDANGFASCTADCEGLGSCINPSYEQFKTTFAGAEVLNIDLEKGLSERGRISHYDAKEYDQPYFYEDWEKKVQRIIYIGKNLYTVSSKLVKVADKETVKETGQLAINN